MKSPSKVSRYEKQQLETLKYQKGEAKKDFIAVCEALMIKDVNEPKKQPYPQWHKWKVEREDLQRRFKKTLKAYQLATIKVNTLEVLIRENKLRNE